MCSLRRLRRVTATALAYALFGLAGLLLPPVAGPWIRWRYRDPNVRQRQARQVVQWLFETFLRILRGLGLVRWRIDGAEHLHQGSALVLANHPSLLDVVLLVAHIPEANCIIKGKLAGNPAMRGFIRLTGYITNDHGPELMAAAAESVRRGATLVMFPEGTRSRPGQPLTFKRGAANIALTADARIVPVLIECRPAALGKAQKWYQIPDEPVDYRLCAQPPLTLGRYAGLPRTVAARRLTRDLEDHFRREICKFDQEQKSQ